MNGSCGCGAGASTAPGLKPGEAQPPVPAPSAASDCPSPAWKLCHQTLGADPPSCCPKVGQFVGTLEPRCSKEGRGLKLEGWKRIVEEEELKDKLEEMDNSKTIMDLRA